MTFPVIKTKRPVALLGPEFGPFLYASVGDEGNGMTLSVLSTLARRNLDPWQEAAELAVLPVEVATKRLASFLAGLSGMATRLDAGKTANRLMLLLPRQTGSTAPRNATVVDGALGMTKGSLVIWMLMVSLIMGGQILAASRQPPAHTKQAIAPAAASAPKGAPAGLRPISVR